MDERRESIAHLDEWRLLVDVCRIFACKHSWTARSPNEVDKLSVKRQAELFKVNIDEIGVHVDTELVLGADARDDFILAIEALLSNLESLVDEKRLPMKGQAHLLHRFPKLVALKTMLDRGEPLSIENFGQYLHLSQDARSFKRTRFAVQTFNISSRVLLGDARTVSLQAASADTSTLAPVYHPQSSFSPSFWNGSKRLFDHLVVNVQECDEKNVKKQEHKLLLRLKNISDYYGQDGMHPRISILLASCLNPKSWHQTICSIPSQSLTKSETFIPNICLKAREMFLDERLFWIELCNEQFIDKSDLVFGTPLDHPPTEHTKSLSDLLAEKIVSDRYQFRPEDKRIIAFNLAYALLQFYEGPWIQTLWTPDHIHFMYEKGTSTVYDIRQPYISCILSNEPPQMGSLDSAHKYPLMLSFAKLLLELEIGEPVQAQERRNGASSVLQPLIAYCETKSKEQLDRHYAKALIACVKFQQFLSEEKERDPGTTCRDVILHRIVHPLEERLNESPKTAKWNSRNLDLKTGIPVQEPLDEDKVSSSISSEGDKRFRRIQPPFDPPTIPIDDCTSKNIERAAQIRKSGVWRRLVVGIWQMLFSDEISTKTFDYLNSTVSKWLLYKPRYDKPIKIAVLDTGLDGDHEDFQRARTTTFTGKFGDEPNPMHNEDPQINRIKSYRNFCTTEQACDHNVTDQDNEDTLADVQDFDGHGTKVAGIILRLAPDSELFIAKVCIGGERKLPAEESKFQKPEPDVVAAAIRWAIKKGVHIINLSLGFRNYGSRLDDLQRALEEAAKARIVIFASTTNEGYHEKVAWPASDANFALGVSASVDNGGTKSSFTGMHCPHGANLMVVGENILSQRLGGGFTVCNGSSFATPVAAAIGALVMAFIEQLVCRKNREEARSSINPEDIHTNSGMLKVLKGISSRPEQHYWTLDSQLFWADYEASSSNDEGKAREFAWSIIKKALHRGGSR
ncbi:hypothetical protein DPSP01_013881 [Paraphaeosphaeria sporulosa]